MTERRASAERKQRRGFHAENAADLAEYARWMKERAEQIETAAAEYAALADGLDSKDETRPDKIPELQALQMIADDVLIAADGVEDWADMAKFLARRVNDAAERALLAEQTSEWGAAEC